MVLRHWTPADRDFHALLGMHAFGLEECGEYGRSEERGREAVALNSRDAWAQHAVAHVLEMQGRIDEGIAWMRGNEQGWATDNFFCRPQLVESRALPPRQGSRGWGRH